MPGLYRGLADLKSSIDRWRNLLPEAHIPAMVRIQVARDVAGELVAVLGGKADAATVTAAVTARLKG